MDLRGDLTVFEPFVVFQFLALAGSTGQLSLSGTDNDARVFFERGSITFAEIASRPVKLGEFLVSQNLLSERRLKRALMDKPTGKRLGAFLVERDLIDADALNEAVKEQIKEVIYEVVRWRKGVFEFTNDARPDAEDILIDIPLDHLILEGLKRMDEEGDSSR